jgi:ketosteroid isomerase-like protein
MSITLKRYLLPALCLAMIGCSPAPMPSEATTDTSNAAPSDAQPMSPQAVVEQHVEAMKTGDIELIMRDYADDVVVITPQGLVSDQTPATGPGVFSGIADAQRVFATITQPANMEAVRGMEIRIEPKGDDIAFLYWTMSKGTPDELSGVDVFVVRNSKIEFQNIIFNN